MPAPEILSVPVLGPALVAAVDTPLLLSMADGAAMAAATDGTTSPPLALVLS